MISGEAGSIAYHAQRERYAVVEKKPTLLGEAYTGLAWDQAKVGDELVDSRDDTGPQASQDDQPSLHEEGIGGSLKVLSIGLTILQLVEGLGVGPREREEGMHGGHGQDCTPRNHCTCFSTKHHDQLIADEQTYLVSGRAIAQDRSVPNRHGSWASEP